MTSRKLFVRQVLDCIELPLHQNLIYWYSLTTSLEQFLGAIWSAISQAAVLILPQVKFNSQLSCCASFFSQQLWWLWSDPVWISLLHLNSLRNSRFSTSSGLYILRESRGLFDGGPGYLPLPSWKIWGGSVEIYRGIPTQCLDIKWDSDEIYWGLTVVGDWVICAE